MQIKLSFLGAARNVTGSRYLLEANGSKVLVDCGMYQERKLKDRNWEPFLYPPNTIDAVLLTHAHLDHCGLLPKLVHDGFQGNIYCTEATSEIVEIILLDSAHLQEEDAEFKRKRHEKEGRKGPFPEVPLYTTEDVNETLPLFSPVPYREPVQVAEGIEAIFHDAGHVLGSSMIEVVVSQDKEKRSIIFSGDVGRFDNVMLQDPNVFNKTDYVVVESTYGNRVHSDTVDIGDQIAEIVNYTYEAGGNIIVPSFALQRSQKILYYMNELLIQKRIPPLLVFLDSPMAIRITEVFKRHSDLFDQPMTDLLHNNKSPFAFPGLKMTQTTDESKSINQIKGTIMIIAGAGMCNGGRVKHHLVSNISRVESTVLFAGYQAVGTLGRSIVDGAKEVRILGQKYPVRARIAQLYGLSAHADRSELLQWLSGLAAAPRHIFVTHGEKEAAGEFGEFLKQETGWKVSVPEYREEMILD
ncbi:MBL fold metallo-hydrolase RNA specificity domain-containing protein [Chloroflexota bacterium]